MKKYTESNEQILSRLLREKLQTRTTTNDETKS